MDTAFTTGSYVVGRNEHVIYIVGWDVQHVICTLWVETNM
jgi:hypothetical protein